ncbi:maleylacetate reductase [Luteococcus sp. Sow4_B9]|uniref:maleylacetate reductase n=1 Tax=Luteococcus sp. Sow4_B9 TaxID=3438792 RepID=UPI003F96F444
MTTFAHRTLPQTVVLDTGHAAHRLAEALTELGRGRPMVIASPRDQAAVERLTAGLDVALRWDEVVQHVPVEVAERARAAATGSGADVVVCIGGGSAIGLAKAIALTSGLPIVAVPTTYAGSEATRMWGLTQDRTKTTGLDDRVLPHTVIYDAELSATLPVELSVASGLNALAHCVDSLWAPATDPIAQALALEGARALSGALPRIVDEPGNLDARGQCLYGAYLAAVSFATAGSGLHHKICHVLGGTFNLPHAQTHAVVLPHVLALNAPAVPDLAGRLAEAMSPRSAGQAGRGPVSSATEAMARLYDATDAPRSLQALGMPHDGLAEAADRVLAVAPPSNPVEITRETVSALLEAAWQGQS